jgi:hypothetical protein
MPFLSPAILLVVAGISLAKVFLASGFHVSIFGRDEDVIEDVIRDCIRHQDKEDQFFKAH